MNPVHFPLCNLVFKRLLAPALVQKDGVNHLCVFLKCSEKTRCLKHSLPREPVVIVFLKKQAISENTFIGSSDANDVNQDSNEKRDKAFLLLFSQCFFF